MSNDPSMREMLDHIAAWREIARNRGHKAATWPEAQGCAALRASVARSWDALEAWRRVEHWERVYEAMEYEGVLRRRGTS